MNNQKGIHSYTYVLALYYIIAPLEDFLTGSMGTLAKYLAIIIVIAALIESHGVIHFKFTTMNRCILWLMLLSILSLLWSISRSTTADRLVAYILVPGIAIFVELLEFEECEYRIIVNAAIWGGALAIVFLFMTGRFNLTTYYRLTLNESNDPNNFAALLMLPFALCFRRDENERRIDVLLKIILAGIILIVIFYTGSRGGLVSIALMMLVYFILNKAYKKIGFILLGTIAIFIFWQYVLPRLSTQLLMHLSLERVLYDMTKNEGQRGRIWHHVIFEVIPNMYPWGMGAGCQAVVMSKFYGFNKGIHNTYLTMIVEYGWLGIVVFLVMLFSLLKSEHKRKRYLECALVIGMSCIIFFLDAYAKKFFWNAIMILIIGEVARPSKENGIRKKIKV